MFVGSYLERLDGQESEGFASSQPELEGIFLKDCSCGVLNTQLCSR